MEPTEELTEAQIAERNAFRTACEALSVSQLEDESVRIKQEEGTNSRWKRLVIKDVRETFLLRDELTRRLGFPTEGLAPEVMRTLIETARQSRKPGDVTVTPDHTFLEPSSNAPEAISTTSPNSGDAS